MKKKVFCILILLVCFLLTGCEDSKEQQEIDRIGNLINGG